MIEKLTVYCNLGYGCLAWYFPTDLAGKIAGKQSIRKMFSVFHTIFEKLYLPTNTNKNGNQQLINCIEL